MQGASVIASHFQFAITNSYLVATAWSMDNVHRKSMIMSEKSLIHFNEQSVFCVD